MITVVYTMNQGKAIMVAAFLMQSDADTYMKNEKLLETKKTCVDGWAGWSEIREELEKVVPIQETQND